MSDAAFCIDESSFCGLLRDAGTVNLKLTQLVDLIDAARATNPLAIEVVSDIYERSVDDVGTNVAMLLFDESVAHLDRDLSLRLQIHLEQCGNFAPEAAKHPVAMQQSGNSAFVDSDALRHALMSTERYYCVLTSSSLYQSEGAVSLSIANASRNAFILRIVGALCEYFRTLVTEMNPTEKQFFAHMAHCFPNLYFKEGLTFAAFSKPYPENRLVVLEHLAFLNDRFLGLAEEVGWDMPRIINAAPIDLSDESPLTKANKSAIKERDISIGTMTIRCTLHTKLSPQRDRIHFHPPINDIGVGQIIIGILHEHLPT